MQLSAGCCIVFLCYEFLTLWRQHCKFQLDKVVVSTETSRKNWGGKPFLKQTISHRSKHLEMGSASCKKERCPQKRTFTAKIWEMNAINSFKTSNEKHVYPFSLFLFLSLSLCVFKTLKAE